MTPRPFVATFAAITFAFAIAPGGAPPASAFGGITDCNNNTIPDADEIVTYPIAAHVSMSQVPGPPAASVFAGAPDNVTAGLGETGVVTYDFGSNAIVEIFGPDFNVYENVFGGPEDQLVTVEVSVDGAAFTDITATSRPPIPIGGDAGQLDFARAYDIRVSGFAAVRYVRLTAVPGGGGDGLDLDTIGIIHGVDCNDNGVLDTCEIVNDPNLDMNMDGVLDSCEPPECPGDTNGDGVVDVDDIVNVILDFGGDGFAHNGDTDGSGTVDIDDLVLVVLNFGSDCLCKTCS